MSLQSSSSTSTSQNNATVPTPRNPITLRLRKILATNFTDLATIEALHTLSELYASSPDYSPQRGQNDDDDDWSDLDAEENQHQPQEQNEPQPSDAVDETASRARKSMQRDLENKLAQGSQHFLKAFGEVDQVCYRDRVPCHSASLTACLETGRTAKARRRDAYAM